MARTPSRAKTRAKKNAPLLCSSSFFPSPFALSLKMFETSFSFSFSQTLSKNKNSETFSSRVPARRDGVGRIARGPDGVEPPFLPVGPLVGLGAVVRFSFFFLNGKFFQKKRKSEFVFHFSSKIIIKNFFPRLLFFPSLLLTRSSRAAPGPGWPGGERGGRCRSRRGSWSCRGPRRPT